MKRFLIIAAVLASLCVMPSAAEAGLIRNGARAVGRGVVRVAKRLAHPFRRGC